MECYPRYIKTAKEICVVLPKVDGTTNEHFQGSYKLAGREFLAGKFLAAFSADGPNVVWQQADVNGAYIPMIGLWKNQWVIRNYDDPNKFPFQFSPPRYVSDEPSPDGIHPPLGGWRTSDAFVDDVHVPENLIAYAKPYDEAAAAAAEDDKKTDAEI